MTTAIAKVQLSDGRVATVEVDSKMSESQIQAEVAAMERQGAFGPAASGPPDPTAPAEAPPNYGSADPGSKDFSQRAYYQQLNQNLSIPESLGVGFFGGLATQARGFSPGGDTRPQVERDAYKALMDDNPVAMGADIAGNATPMTLASMVPGAQVAKGGSVLLPAAKSLAGRMMTSGAMAGAEGAAMIRGQGGSVGETLQGGATGVGVAAAMEVLIPVLGRMGRAIFRKLGRKPKGALLDASGNPTEEFQIALNDAGVSFDDLTQDAVDFVASQSDAVRPDQVARKARFDAQGVPATTGDITQEFTDQAAEQRLLSMATKDEAAALRMMKGDQSAAFQQYVSNFIDELGVPTEAGESIKAALSGRKKILTKHKNLLYKLAAEKSEDVAGIPLLGDDIVAAMPDPKDLRRRARLAPTEVSALQDLMVEFGLENSDEAVEAFVQKGGEVTPLSLGNVEDFRQALNQIIDGNPGDTQVKRARALVMPIIKALDGEIDTVANSMKQYFKNDSGQELLDYLQRARGKTRTLKTEFSDQSIVGRLVNNRPDGYTPVVEASKVMTEMRNKPVEQVQRVVDSLKRSGPKGNAALSNMQASVVMEALEQGLKAPSRKDAGLELIGGNQFAKFLEQTYGAEKLQLIFSNNPQGLQRLMAVTQTAKDMMPAAAATPKGSAPIILDALKTVGNAPIVATVIKPIEMIVNAGADDRAVARALKGMPVEVKRAVGEFQKAFPQISAALGVGVMLNDEEE